MYEYSYCARRNTVLASVRVMQFVGSVIEQGRGI